MSSELLVVESLPTTRNAAEAVQRFVRDDLIHNLHVDTASADEVADPTSPELVNAQFDRIKKSTENPSAPNFYGAYFNGNLEGILILGEWRRADDIIYDSAMVRTLRRPYARLFPHFPIERKGIFQLSANPELEVTTKNRVLGALVDKAIAHSGEGPFEVFVGLMPHYQDPAADILRDRGFEPTGRMGEPIADTPQMLHRYAYGF